MEAGIVRVSSMADWGSFFREEVVSSEDVVDKSAVDGVLAVRVVTKAGCWFVN